MCEGELYALKMETRLKKKGKELNEKNEKQNRETNLTDGEFLYTIL